jgi:hypothetical protein
VYSQQTKGVEILEKRTNNSKHYQQENGAVTAVISPQSVHFINEKGLWEDINTSIVPSTKVGFDFENSSNGIKSYFGNDGVVYVSGNEEIKVGVNPSIVWVNALNEVSLIETGATSNALVDRNSIVYNNAFQDGKIQYLVEKETIKNNLILNSLPTSLVGQTGSLGFSEEIVLPTGWSIVSAEKKGGIVNGSLSILDASGLEVFVIPPPVAYDSNANGTSITGSSNTDIGYKLVQTATGYTLITLVDLEWLNSASIQFPIVIDPTVALPGVHGGWQNTASIFIEGASPFIYVFSGALSGDVFTSWVKFDVSSLSPCLAVIDSVEAQFGMNLTDNAGILETVNINDITGAKGPYGAYNAAAHADLMNGTYTSFTALAVGTYGYYNLGTAAEIDLANDLASGEFQLGLDIVSPTSFKRFSSELCNLRVTYHDSIIAALGSTDVLVSCDSTLWIDGNYYTTSNNSATFVLPSSMGCDSTVTLDLTVNVSSASTDVITSCDSILWINGSYYSASNNSATHILPNSVGCDSVITLDLTINSSSNSVDVINSCGSYTWIDGIAYTSDNSSATFGLFNTDGCDSIITLNLTIDPLPDNSVTQVAALLTADENGATYQWLDCDNGNSTIPGEVNQSYTPTLTGNYSVIVTLNGCSDTSACYLVDYSGIAELNDQILIVYPNPSNDGCFTIANSGIISSIKIIDILGRIMNIETDFSEGTINASRLKPGKYFIHIEMNEKDFIQEVVIVK